MSNERPPTSPRPDPLALQSMDARCGALIVVSAPSGAGKSSLIKEVLTRVERLSFSVSYTTRHARGAEKQGVDYCFVSMEEFIARRDRGEFLEWAEVHGNLYGTNINSVREELQTGNDVILDIDIQGAEQIRHRTQAAVTVFVLPPSRKELEARLSARNLNVKADLEFRMGNAAKEVRRFEEFDYVIINDDLNRASGALEAIVIAGRQRSFRHRALAQAIIDTFEKEAT
jgi:guanylate kinase